MTRASRLLLGAVSTPPAQRRVPKLGVGFCRRTSDGAAFLVDRVLGDTPIRHWVLSLPPPLRYLLAYDSSLASEVLGAFIDAGFQLVRWKAKYFLGLRSVSLAHPGAVTAIQRASSHLGLKLPLSHPGP